jgi:hypothetical protein
MKKELSTNGVRKKLEALGAVHPSRRAVALVAIEIDTAMGMTTWEIRYPSDVIKAAIEDAMKYNRQGAEAMHRAFARSLRDRMYPANGQTVTPEAQPKSMFPRVGTGGGAFV